MNLAVIHIDKDKMLSHTSLTDYSNALKILFCNGHDITHHFNINQSTNILPLVKNLKEQKVEAVLLTGDCGKLVLSFKEKCGASEDAKAFIIEGTLYIAAESLSAEHISTIVLPILQTKTKLIYQASVFRTFGLAERELTELLKDCIHNKDKITFRLFEVGGLEYEITMRYSNKVHPLIAQDLVKRTLDILQEHVYAHQSQSLQEAVLGLLHARGQALSVAESFTGGALSASLVAIKGASSVFKEGIVAYTDSSKMKRLQVDPKILKRFSAVSFETVYEMAAHVLMESGADYCIATTGYADESVVDPERKGYFFVAVGSNKGIHLYEHAYGGNRSEVIQFGVQYSLFKLYKLLTDNTH